MEIIEIIQHTLGFCHDAPVHADIMDSVILGAPVLAEAKGVVYLMFSYVKNIFM